MSSDMLLLIYRCFDVTVTINNTSTVQRMYLIHMKVKGYRKNIF